MQALGLLFQTEFSDLTNGLLTVTKVRMAPDLKSGRVYVSLLGGNVSEERLLADLRQVAPKLRSRLMREVRMKFAPELFFYIDDTQQEVMRVENIFRKLEEERRAQNPDETTEN